MAVPTPLVLATGNAGKVREICAILGEATGAPLAAAPVEAADGSPVGYVVAAPAAIDAARAAIVAPERAPDVTETGTTLEENARIKAAAVAGALGLPAIADDTGLEVDALGGAPGVHAARYAGPDADPAANVAKLLRALEGVAPDRRTARFATVVLLREPGGGEWVVRGEVQGRITEAPRGDGGFGYDPVFAPDDAGGATFAEMPAAAKHARSHRGRAVRALADALVAESGGPGPGAYAPGPSAPHGRR